LAGAVVDRKPFLTSEMDEGSFLSLSRFSNTFLFSVPQKNLGRALVQKNRFSDLQLFPHSPFSPPQAMVLSPPSQDAFATARRAHAKECSTLSDFFFSKEPFPPQRPVPPPCRKSPPFCNAEPILLVFIFLSSPETIPFLGEGLPPPQYSFLSFFPYKRVFPAIVPPWNLPPNLWPSPPFYKPHYSFGLTIKRSRNRLPPK